ncbi:MAG TPA: ribosome maturation factor RimM [Thioalkalivibrio sp.]|nr:ribosome maturation factor RimM [Thioalkalivibrio sp.]
MGGADSRKLLVGRISGVFGVQGWVKVYSDTDPRDNIVHYPRWYLKRGGEWQSVEVEGGRLQGKAVVAKLKGVDDRDAALLLRGVQIAIDRDELDELEAGEYYWDDLIGLQVVTLDGVELGRVERLLETGANDVLVVAGERERLIPYIREQVIAAVDLDAGEIRVDWDPDF